MKILLVEDEPALREIIRKFLEKEHYIVESAATFNDALIKVEDYDYDCILLDIMLPDGNGLAVLKHLKTLHKHENVIIISAKDSLDDRVAGLELGADDYLPKPFHLAELNARIKSVFRRSRMNGELFIEAGNIRINPDSHEVLVNGKSIELNRKEYDILHYFVTRRGDLVDKNTLAEAVWGDYIDQVDSFDFIYAQVKNLRKKLTEAAASVEIKAVYGFGYKFIINEL
ncbi:MAG: response regulator transcription factor [Cytophagaceae bacterium]|jgi:DNA-binding response OmpR family regulator|nr:response regulator transcription factor [Cytophagaceae bacterium]